MPTNYLQAFRGPDRAQIDRSAYSNKLLRNEVDRLPQRNRAEDVAMQAEEMAISESQKQTAAGLLAHRFAAVAGAQSPKMAAQQFLSDPNFVAAGKLVGLPVEQFTITDADTDDAVRSSAQSWAQALGGAGGQGAPAGVVQFEHLASAAGLSPQDRARAARVDLGLDSRAGQGRVSVVNGVPTWTGMGDDGQPYQIPLSTLQQTAAAGGEIKQAEALGSGRGQAQAAAEAGAPQRAEKRRLVVTSIDNVLSAVDRASAGINWSTVGAGSLTRAVPGTPAYDLAQNLTTIKANLGFDRLQQMRDASPTGGALGQVAIQELAALQASVASLDQAQSGAQIKNNLDLIRRHYENWKRVVQQAEAMESGGMPDFTSMTDEQLMQIINGK